MVIDDYYLKESSLMKLHCETFDTPQPLLFHAFSQKKRPNTMATRTKYGVRSEQKLLFLIE